MRNNSLLISSCCFTPHKGKFRNSPSQDVYSLDNHQWTIVNYKYLFQFSDPGGDRYFYNSNVATGFFFNFPELRVVLLCLPLQGDGEVECPDGGG